MLQVDPPVAAKADADPTEQRQAAAAAAAEGLAEPDREASPPGFEMAAKKEHLSEAEALRRHREEVSWIPCAQRDEEEPLVI